MGAKEKKVRMNRFGKQGTTAGLVVAGLAVAVIAYSAATDVEVRHEMALAAAVVLGATGHLALAHLQGRIDRIHAAKVVSMAVVGVVAGVVGVLLAAVSNDEATTAGLAAAGMAGAIAGAETLTRFASRAQGGPAISNIDRTGDTLTLTGEGLGEIKHVMVGETPVKATVSGNTLTFDVPPGTAPGTVVEVGANDQVAKLALPAAPPTTVQQ